jgi:hypothetical protein
MDRSEILQKLSAGEIGVEEAERLLRESHSGAESMPAAQPEVTEQAEPQAPAQPQPVEERDPKSGGAKDRPRWLHVRVGDVGAEGDRVRINIPIGIVRAGLRFGSHFGCGLTGDVWQEVVAALRDDVTGTLVDVEDIEKGERVHIFVD